MKIVKLEAENFGPFARFELPLADRGLLLVQGDNRLSPSADSNGAGKSMIIEALVWTLTGGTIRGMAADGVINNRARKNCRAAVTIRDGGDTIVIERGRKHRELKNGVRIRINGADVTPGTVRDADARIAEIIGFDHETLCHAIYFDADNIPKLPALSDKQIKNIIERTLGIDVFDRALEVVRQMKADARSEVAAARHAVEKVEQLHERATADLAELRRLSDGWRAQQATRVAQARADADAAAAGLLPEARRVALESELSETKEALAALQLPYGELAPDDGELAEAARAQALVGEIARTAQTLERERERLADLARSGKIEEVLAADGVLLYLDERLEGARSELEALARACGGVCPTCGQPVSDPTKLAAHRRRIEARAAEAEAAREARSRLLVEELASAVAQSAERVRALEAALAADRARLAELNDRIARARDEQRRRQEVVVRHARLSARIAELEGRLKEAEAAAEACARARRHVDELAAEEDPYATPIAARARETSELAQRFAEARATLALAEAELGRLELLESLYGPKGLRVNVIEQATPILNERSNHYARRLTDGEMTITFETIGRNAKGEPVEKFSVAAANRNGGASYAELSSGERRKIDLAIALALSDLAGSRSRRALDLWCADEITENLDSTAVLRVVEVLEDIARRRGTALVISHTPMDDLISQCVVVTKTAKGSEITDQTGW